MKFVAPATNDAKRADRAGVERMIARHAMGISNSRENLQWGGRARGTQVGRHERRCRDNFITGHGGANVF